MPYLSHIRIVKVGSWKEARAILQGEMPKVRQAFAGAFRAEAKLLKSVLVDGIKAQAPGGAAFKPLAASTIAVRKFLGIKGTKALIRTGQTIKGIKVTPFGRSGSVAYTVFVGILKGTMGPDGKSLLDKMLLSEYGGPAVVVPITDKMRKFLAMALGPVKALRKLGPPQGKKGFLIVKVPKRPVFEPVWNMWGKTSGARIIGAARLLYKGPFLPS